MQVFRNEIQRSVRRAVQICALGFMAAMGFGTFPAAAQLADHAVGSSFALPIQDLVYFGTYWFELQGTSTAAPIALGGGYANPKISWNAESGFFSGTIEKLDATGQVTDVIYTTHGAGGVGSGGVEDQVTGDEVTYQLPCAECDQVVAEFAAIWSNPRYANAHLHVTGISLGAVFTQYLAAYSVATYGQAATLARADFTQFAPPPAGTACALKWNVPTSIFNGLLYGYDPANDQIQVSTTGPEYGTMTYLAPYHPIPLAAAFEVDALSAHWPSPYAEALGLPSWLTPEQQAAATAAIIAARSTTEDGITIPVTYDDPTYGPPGGVPMVVQGDAGNNVINGSSGNDVIIGGGGQDILTGGGGTDLFVYNAVTDSGPTPANADIITDFSSSLGDQIDLRGINASLGAAGTQNIQFVGMAPLSGVNQIGFYFDQGDTWIQGSFGANATPNFFIHLTGIHSLTTADFLLYTAPSQPTYTVGYTVY